MSSSASPIAMFELMATGENGSTWGTKANVAFQVLERFGNGVTSITMNSATKSLTTATDYSARDWHYAVFNLASATQAANLVLPSKQKFFGVKNSATGAYTATVKTATGTGIAVAQGERAVLYNDGTNVEKLFYSGDWQPLDADLTAIGALAKTDGNIIVGDGSTWVAESGATARTSLGLAIGTDVQAYDADLTAVAGLSSAGLVARSGAGTAAARTVTAPAAGITVSNGDGAAGNPTLALANDLAAVEGLASTGIAVRSASDTWVQRSVAAGAGIGVTNGDGVSGNPTVAVDITGATSATGGAATDDEVLVYDLSATAIRKVAVSSITSAGAGTMKVSSNDTTAGYLNGKLVAGTGITLTEGSDGGNETLTVAADLDGPASSTDNAWARWNGTGGSAVQNGTWTEDDSGNVTAGGTLDMGTYDLTVDTLIAEKPAESKPTFNSSASGEITLSTPVTPLIITGDTTILMPGPQTPGHQIGWNVLIAQDGTGGWDVGWKTANLLTYSEQFENVAGWTKAIATISANAVAAPDGRTTADKAISSSLSGQHTVIQSVTTAPNAHYTLSSYVKAAEYSVIRLHMDKDAAFVDRITAEFNVSTGAITSAAAGAGSASSVSASIESVGGGWYRCSISGVLSSTSGASVRCVLYLNGDATYTGDDASGMYIWGAQLVTGSSALGYIPVVASRDLSWANTEPSWAAQAASTKTKIALIAFPDGVNAASDITGDLT